MHSCPNCGQACYCSGDIDDTEVEQPPHCRHACQPEFDEPDYDAAKPLTALENYQRNDEHHQ